MLLNNHTFLHFHLKMRVRRLVIYIQFIRHIIIVFNSESGKINTFNVPTITLHL